MAESRTPGWQGPPPAPRTLRRPGRRRERRWGLPTRGGREGAAGVLEGRSPRRKGAARDVAAHRLPSRAVPPWRLVPF